MVREKYKSAYKNGVTPYQGRKQVRYIKTGKHQTFRLQRWGDGDKLAEEHAGETLDEAINEFVCYDFRKLPYGTLVYVRHKRNIYSVDVLGHVCKVG
jgi:hypothetical protein